MANRPAYALTAQSEAKKTSDPSSQGRILLSNPTSEDAEAFVENLLCRTCGESILGKRSSVHPQVIVDTNGHKFGPTPQEVLNSHHYQHVMHHISEAERPLEIFKTILRDVNPRVNLIPSGPRKKGEWCHFAQLRAYHSPMGAITEKSPVEGWHFDLTERPWFEFQCQIVRHAIIRELPEGHALSGLKKVKECLDACGTQHVQRKCGEYIDNCIKDAVKAMNGQMPYRRNGGRTEVGFRH